LPLEQSCALAQKPKALRRLAGTNMDELTTESLGGLYDGSRGSRGNHPYRYKRVVSLGIEQ